MIKRAERFLPWNEKLSLWRRDFRSIIYRAERFLPWNKHILLFNSREGEISPLRAPRFPPPESKSHARILRGDGGREGGTGKGRGGGEGRELWEGRGRGTGPAPSKPRCRRPSKIITKTFRFVACGCFFLPAASGCVGVQAASAQKTKIQEAAQTHYQKLPFRFVMHFLLAYTRISFLAHLAWSS